jgi:hypothetical protein
MGLGYSVEQLGKSLVGEKNGHIVTEGLALAIGYVAIRYVIISVRNGDEVK